MAAQSYAKISDGWHLSIDLTDETVNSVPNLAAAANSREAFVIAPTPIARHVKAVTGICAETACEL